MIDGFFPSWEDGKQFCKLRLCKEAIIFVESFAFQGITIPPYFVLWLTNASSEYSLFGHQSPLVFKACSSLHCRVDSRQDEA